MFKKIKEMEEEFKHKHPREWQEADELMNGPFGFALSVAIYLSVFVAGVVIGHFL